MQIFVYFLINKKQEPLHSNFFMHHNDFTLSGKDGNVKVPTSLVFSCTHTSMPSTKLDRPQVCFSKCSV